MDIDGSHCGNYRNFYVVISQWNYSFDLLLVRGEIKTQRGEVSDRSPLKRNIWHSYSSGRGSGIFRGTNRCSDCHYPTSSAGVRHCSTSESTAKTSELADCSKKSIWIRHKHEGKIQLINMPKLFQGEKTNFNLSLKVRQVCHLSDDASSRLSFRKQEKEK